MIYLIIGIIIITIIIYFLLKDIYKLLRLTSIITILSGYLTIIIGYIVTNIIKNKVSFINISKITKPIFNECVDKGLILILIGTIELITYVLLNVYRKYYPKREFV